MDGIRFRVERELERIMDIRDERGLDPRWARAAAFARELVLRPAKRTRPALLVSAYGVARGTPVVPARLWRFAAGLELLHAFLLIHDDVADRAELRRGSPALHRLLASGRKGEDLAVVVGDHLFARSVEVMLETGLPRSPEVVAWLLGICRHTAVGQYLDLDLSEVPLRDVTLWHTLKVAHLKTSQYGFVAPLVAGARLGGASESGVETFERVGRHLGLAFQLRDDLIGLYGDPSVSGKSADSDFAEGKRTFPVAAAYARADEASRKRLEFLWSSGRGDAGAIEEARALVDRLGGREATERAIDRSTRAARRAIAQLPRGPAAELLDAYAVRLARRAA